MEYELINRLVPTGQHQEAAAELAAKVLKAPPLSARAGVRLSCRQWVQPSAEAQSHTLRRAQGEPAGPCVFVVDISASSVVYFPLRGHQERDQARTTSRKSLSPWGNDSRCRGLAPVGHEPRKRLVACPEVGEIAKDKEDNQEEPEQVQDGRRTMYLHQ
jgi:hypothetical protein